MFFLLLLFIFLFWKFVEELKCVIKHFGYLEMNYFSHVTSGSKSCVLSLTSDVSSFKEIRAHKLRIVAIVSRCYEMKPENFQLRFKRRKPPYEKERISGTSKA
ncbi:hypothetical protein OIU79_009602 [Salix purpurea]|uniref:Uncharacterized protein n=1 Tax=Salix purpurea TaxID=77065 RepID=A0A9Q0T8T3_SALPP|nr:hypothetical protein OIU79_009602 [Salix purpurea]